MKNNPEAFCQWLQGYVEINGTAPSLTQWKVIVEHLQLVFEKVTGGVKPLAAGVAIKREGDNHIVAPLTATPALPKWQEIYKGYSNPDLYPYFQLQDLPKTLTC